MFLLRKRLTKKEDNLSGMARSQGNWSHLTLSHFWGEKKKKASVRILFVREFEVNLILCFSRGSFCSLLILFSHGVC